MQAREYSKLKQVIQYISLDPLSERAIQLPIRNIAFHKFDSVSIKQWYGIHHIEFVEAGKHGDGQEFTEAMATN